MTLVDMPCSYCFAPSDCWDHVHPKSKGGSNDPSNLVPACTPCNLAKRDVSLLAFLLRRAGKCWDDIECPPLPEDEDVFDPVGLPEIADRLGRAHQTVKQWNCKGILPPPDCIIGNRFPVWNWPRIERWAHKTGRALR